MWCFVSARSLNLLLLAFFTPLHMVFLTNLGLLTTTNSPIYKPWAYISLLKSFRGAYKGRGLYPTEVIAGIEKALPHKLQQCWSKYIVISITQGSKNHQRCSYILWWFASRAEEILKYLCVIVDESLSCSSHISYVASRAYPKLKLLNRILSYLDPTTLLKIYKATMLPILDCGCILWGSYSK